MTSERPGAPVSRRRLPAVISAAVDVVPVGAAGAGLVLMLLGVVGLFFWWLALPLGVAAAIAAVRWWRPASVAASRFGAWVDGGVVVAIGVWAVIQGFFVAQWVVPWRDPGVYLMQGVWLADTGSLGIPVPAAAELADEVDGATAAVGPWFDARNSMLRLQGGVGLSAFVGVGRWIGGLDGALTTGVVLGAFALLALHAVGRRLLGRAWALLPVALLAVSLPWAAFTRGPYSEIPVLFYVLVGVLLAGSLVSTARRKDAIAVGVAFGATAFLRIDSAAIVIGVVLALAAAALLSHGDHRVRLARAAVTTTLVMFGTMLLAFVAIAVNTPRYLRELGPETVALTGGAAIICAVALLLLRRGLRNGWTIGRRFVIGSVVFVGALFVFWASRPLWFAARFQYKPVYQDAIESYQRVEGLAVDGARSYDEWTLWWMAWYFGIAFLLIAAAGTVLATWRALRHPNAVLLIVLGVVLVNAVLYLDISRVTPDQVWAMRRLIAVIVPGFAIAAALALAALAARGLVRRIVAAVLVLALLVPTAFALRPLVATVEGEGQVDELQTVCAALSGEVIVVAGDDAPSNYAVTLRVLCGIETVTLAIEKGEPMADVLVGLRELADAAGGEVELLTFDERLAVAADAGDPVNVSDIVTWERRIMQIPDEVWTTERTAWVVTIQG